MELFSSSSSGCKKPSKKNRSASSSSSSVTIADGPSSVITSVDDCGTFTSLGLCDWLCKSALLMGFKRPTEIQAACIPAILEGRDVMGCAETGSGKTAAFALPILHHLSSDPYGIFGVILTPTRELALQISEQFSALGASLGLRVCLVIGGVNMTLQSQLLSKRPHIVIATPGRLRHHLEGADPPNLSKAMYLVLDEADRLLSQGFESELKCIMSHMHTNRKTLLFSATLTDTLSDLEKMTSSSTLRFDLTSKQKIPSTLLQQYLFMPSQVKLCYLVSVLNNIISKQVESRSNKQHNDDNDDDIKNKLLMEILQDNELKLGGKFNLPGTSTGENQSKSGNNKKKSSKKLDMMMNSSTVLRSSSNIMIFVGTCRRCQEITEVLQQLGFDCVALHSMMNQARRLASLGKFKSNACRILIATDVASRGLDIPAVDLVINLDLPKVAADYVHRIGRTARAGRAGRSLSLITQYDVDLVHTIEAYTEQKMMLSTEVNDEDVVKLLNTVSKAMRVAQLRLLEHGFEDQVEKFTSRKNDRKQKRKLASISSNVDTTDNE